MATYAAPEVDLEIDRVSEMAPLGTTFEIKIVAPMTNVNVEVRSNPRRKITSSPYRRFSVR
jgi:hypothetical protein